MELTLAGGNPPSAGCRAEAVQPYDESWTGGRGSAWSTRVARAIRRTAWARRLRCWLGGDVDATNPAGKAAHSAERAWAIVNTASNGILTFDERGVIETCNPAAEPLFRSPASDLVGQNVDGLLPGLLQPAAGGNGVIRLTAMGRELTARRCDGGEFPVELTVSEMALDGRRTFTCVVRDITERKRMEEAQKLFLASTTHDVGNVLTAIAGYATGLSDSVATDEDRRELGRITTLTQTLSAIMRDIVVHSGVGSPQEAICAPVPIGALLTACAKDIERECREKGIGLRVDAPAGATIVTDGVKVMRVIHNLLRNAVRYTERGQIEVRAEATEEEFHIHVRDTGIGIPAADLSRIFEPYYRHADACAMQQWGTGLGLATVKRFCDLLGGSVGVESTPGVGTEFDVRIPQATATPDGARPMPPHFPTSTPATQAPAASL